MQGTSTEMMLWMAVLSAVIVGALIAFGVWAVRRLSERVEGTIPVGSWRSDSPEAKSMPTSSTAVV